MKKLSLLIFALLMVLLLGGGIWGWMKYQAWNQPWGDQDFAQMVEIEPGKSAREIAAMLKDMGVIDNELLFLAVADLRGLGDKLKAGEYEISGSQTPYEVMDMLARGDAYLHALVIPEGYTQIQIAEAAEKINACSKEDFLAECRNDSVFGFVVVDAPDGANAEVEGVLFPDTYYLIRNTPAERVYHKFKKRFNEVHTAIVDEVIGDATGLWWQDESEPYVRQMHKYITLASIIEREAKRDEDRAKIASVFVNRIKAGMPLQSDATIHYALNDWSKKLSRADLEYDSPYNTYKNPGLPPAAICNPGRASIEAAIKPADTDYLYFLANAKGETLFTADYQEFLTLKRQIKEEQYEASHPNVAEN